MVFSLGVFHLSLFFTFRSLLHGWLSLGWFLNCLYLALENRALNHELEPIIPYYVSTLLLLFFVLAGHVVRDQSLRTTGSIVITGLAMGVIPTVIHGTNRETFLWKTLLGSLFGCYVYLRLGRGFAKLDLTNLGRVFLRSGSLLYPQHSPSDVDRRQRFLPVDTAVRNLRRGAVGIGNRGSRIIYLSFAGFGLLQLLYPFHDILLQSSQAFWLSLFYLGMILKLGTGVGFIFLVTSHTRWVEVLNRQAELSQDLARITASVEHDMRGPIGELNTVILQLHEKAREGNEKIARFLEDEAKYLTYILARVRTVMELILAMRESPEEFSRRRRLFSLGDALKQATVSLRILHDKQAPIFDDKGVNPNIRLSGDPRRLAQALRNILNNGIEATLMKRPENRPTIHLSTDVSKRSGWVTVSIRDEGIGIPPELIPSITQAGVSTKEDSPTPNRGLGLFISQKLVALHGGELEFSSTVGEGTTVRVSLPFSGDDQVPTAGGPNSL